MFFVTVGSVILASLTLRSAGLDTRSGTLLWRDDGYYSQIEVREVVAEDGTVTRHMYREVNNSSAVILGTSTYAFPYAEFARAHEFLNIPAKNFLLLGGGAYTIPRTLLIEDQDILVDVVELEPKLLDLAYTYFDLPRDNRMRDYPMDARTYLLNSTNTYDVIFADAFNSGHYIPPHLTTEEFFTLVRERLSPNGLFVTNIIGQAYQTDRSLAGSLIKTIASVFPNYTVYTTQPGIHNRLQNLMVLARKDDLPTTLPDTTLLKTSERTTRQASELVLPPAVFSLDEQTIFTDDKAPVEYLVGKQIVTSRR
jgi:spermidine synthase